MRDGSSMPDLVCIALEDWLTFWSRGRDDWEPEDADGCQPLPCDCGLLALIHQSRLALGGECCGQDEHPGIAPVAP